MKEMISNLRQGEKVLKKTTLILGLFFLGFVTGINVYAQTKIKDGTGGLVTPDANAILELESTNKGLLLPRVDLQATNLPAPLTAHVQGMTVYNKATAGAAPHQVEPGYYYNDGAKWIRLVSREPDLRVVGTDNHITQDAGIGSNGTSAGPGVGNIGIGINSLTMLNSTDPEKSSYNVALGSYSMWNTTTGYNNVAVGTEALKSNTTGDYNVAIGPSSLPQSQSGSDNIGIGRIPLMSLINGYGNTGIGGQSLQGVTSGTGNIGVGTNSGDGLVTGNENIFIGSGTTAKSAGIDNSLNIGNVLYGKMRPWASSIPALPPGRIGINRDDPQSSLDVNGSLSVGIRTIDASTATMAERTLDDRDFTVIYEVPASVPELTKSLYIPDASTCKGRILYLITNFATMQNVEVIGGAAQLKIRDSTPLGVMSFGTGYINYTFQSSGTYWILLSVW